MSARVLSSSSSAEAPRDAGLRPINLRTDLHDVADLLELAFGSTLDASGRAMLREMRMLSRSGPLLWAVAGLNRMVKGMLGGYVWIAPDSGALVGNVSLYPTGHDDTWVVANVAVHPGFRRQGIAQALMRAALADARRQEAASVVLQVEEDNVGARQLYHKLGFEDMRTFTRWRRRPHLLPPRSLDDMPDINFRRRGEWQQQLDLAERLRPNEYGGLAWLRPTRKDEFQRPWWKRLLGSFSMNTIQHWVIRDAADEQLLATVRAETLWGRAYTRLDLLVHPEHQGQLERPFLNYLLRFWHNRGKGLVVEHPADDLAARSVFREYDFEATHHLAHMIWRP